MWRWSVCLCLCSVVSVFSVLFRSNNTGLETFIHILISWLNQEVRTERALEFLIYVLRPARRSRYWHWWWDCAVYWLVLFLLRLTIGYSSFRTLTRPVGWMYINFQTVFAFFRLSDLFYCWVLKIAKKLLKFGENHSRIRIDSFCFTTFELHVIK